MNYSLLFKGCWKLLRREKNPDLVVFRRFKSGLSVLHFNLCWYRYWSDFRFNALWESHQIRVTWSAKTQLSLNPDSQRKEIARWPGTGSRFRLFESHIFLGEMFFFVHRRYDFLMGRTTDRGSDLKLQLRSRRWYNSSLAITLAREFSFCGRTTAPGCCTCRGKLRWRAVKAGEESYSPGKLLFAGVINWIIFFTLAREFSNLLLQLRGASSNKK